MNAPKLIWVQGTTDAKTGKNNFGNSVQIYKDHPCKVSEEFRSMVLAVGGYVVEEDGTKVPVVEQPEPTLTTDEANAARLIEVCEELVITNEVRNFTRTGRPRIEVVRAMIDFTITTDELRTAYEAANTGIEDGDNGTEHTTEGSDTTG